MPASRQIRLKVAGTPLNLVFVLNLRAVFSATAPKMSRNCRVPPSLLDTHSDAMFDAPARRVRRNALTLLLLSVWANIATSAFAAGEPAEEFLKQLRAAKYFDTAIMYLDRLDQFPGVDPDLTSAIPLEKAQTYISAAFATRNPDARDKFFASAEEQLGVFLQQGTHKRLSEARLQLGWIQMVRAAQLISGEPDDSKRKLARESYLAASKTFDLIVESLRSQLKEMQGAKIDAKKDPERAALRDQYRGEFLQALMNSAESRKLAAKTFNDPRTEGKALLEVALKKFTELSENYDTYVQGAAALAYRGQVLEELGRKDEAIDSYLRMLESPEADPLRDVKYQATSGLIRYWLAESPPKFQASIDRAQGLVDGVRPDERGLPSVQELRLDLAKALLLKSKDTENQKPADLKRAESAGRQLLIQSSKIPGKYGEEANKLLAGMGVDLKDVPPPSTAEEPESLQDAYEKAQELYALIENMNQSFTVLDKQENQSDEIQTQKTAIQDQLLETRSDAIYILRRGLALVVPDSDINFINQTRQMLAYLLYQDENYRDSAVVGSFLAKNSPSTQIGLKGGLLALNSYQLLLKENADNPTLIQQLEDLGAYLIKTWPDNEEASSAQGVMIKLALRNDRWDDARAMVEKMPDEGPERPYFKRVMGQLLWNESVLSRQDGNDADSDRFLGEAEQELRAGLDGIPGNVVDPEGMSSALILAKIYLMRGDVEQAASTLYHTKYGPAKLIESQGAPDNQFPTDLYTTELKVVVQQLTSSEGDSKELLDRAIAVMEKLRASIKGENAQQRLTKIFIDMAEEIREQLDVATPENKAKLIDAFRVFLQRIAETTDDQATLTWVGNTLIDLAEASMQPNQTKARGQSEDLLKTAVQTFDRLKGKLNEVPPEVSFQLGKANRLLGNYQASINTLGQLLQKTPMMLDAQIEAALAYEQWAAVVEPKYVKKAYESALNGSRPGADGKNVIWGWGRISQLTQRVEKYNDKFFEARYHVALCRFRWGQRTKNKQLIEKSIVDIKRVADLYPQLGGPQQHRRFDVLLKTIQKELGKAPNGLGPFPVGKK